MAVPKSKSEVIATPQRFPLFSARKFTKFYYQIVDMKLRKK